MIGSPHPVKGYEIKAFVILTKGFSACEELAEDLFAFARKNLAPYKMPRIIEFVDDLPKTISGKIRRGELRANEAQNKLQGIQSEHEFFYKRNNRKPDQKQSNAGMEK